MERGAEGGLWVLPEKVKGRGEPEIVGPSKMRGRGEHAIEGSWSVGPTCPIKERTVNVSAEGRGAWMGCSEDKNTVDCPLSCAGAKSPSSPHPGSLSLNAGKC